MDRYYIDIVDNIDHRGFTGLVSWFSAVTVILRHGRENQHSWRNFSI